MHVTIRRIEVTLAVLGLVVALALGAWITFAVTSTRADVALTTTPSRASVEIDGNFRGTTPLHLDDLPVGTHFLHVTRHGFRPLLRKVDLLPGHNALNFELSALAGCALEITSRPEGAEVFVDGESRGHTPLVLSDLAAGEHEVRLSEVNYIDRIERVEVSQDEQARLDITLMTRMEEFYLRKIEADPTSAEPHTDLAHYYILQHEWKKAEDRYAEALGVIANEPQSRAYTSRLLDELRRVMIMQFDYGDQTDLQKGRVTIVNALEKAMMKSPRYRYNYDYGINLALYAGDTERAARLMEKGILAFPKHLDWITRSIRAWGQREIGPVIQRFEKRVKKDPNDFACRYMLYCHARQQGRLEGSATELEALAGMTRDPRIAALLLRDLGRIREQRKEYDKAVEAYRRAVEREPEPKKKAPIQFNLVRALVSAKKTDQLPAAWKHAVALQQNVEVANRWRLSWAEACIDAGQKDDARRILREVIKLAGSQGTREKAQNLLKKIKS